MLRAPPGPTAVWQVRAVVSVCPRFNTKKREPLTWQEIQDFSPRGLNHALSHQKYFNPQLYLDLVPVWTFYHSLNVSAVFTLEALNPCPLHRGSFKRLVERKKVHNMHRGLVGIDLWKSNIAFDSSDYCRVCFWVCVGLLTDLKSEVNLVEW